MPMWPYKDFDACVLDQKSKWHSEKSSKKICWTIKAKVEMWEELSQELSEQTKITPQLAKRIIDNLQARWMALELFNSILLEIKTAIKDEAIAEKLNKTNDEEIWKAIDEIAWNCQELYNEKIKELAKIWSNDEFPHFLYSQPEITFSEWETFSEDKQYELITTAKQTDSRYWDFAYSKSDLENMAKNFNDDIVWTEIPVDLNHDPEHIAYAWIKPKSMEVKKSTKLDWQYSLYAQLYKFTPEGKDLVTNWKVRYFSLQIQNKFEKFVDKTKKVYNLVIRALALTNMPVIKDMAPTFAEADILIHNHTDNMEKEQLEAQLSESTKALSEKDKMLAEKDAENKKLSEELEKVNSEKREKTLSEGVEKLCLSENNKIGFKWGEKESILEFVKTLSDDQAQKYFALHQNILTTVSLWEEGEAWDAGEWVEWDANKIVENKALAMAKEKGISVTDAYDIVLSENPELAKRVY